MSHTTRRDRRYGDDMTSDDYLADLRTAYDNDVERRNAMGLTPWRMEIIDAFLATARREDRSRILELGSGTGQIAAHVDEAGFDVTAIDLSPANVAATKARGVTAIEADFGDMPFPDAAFEAAFGVMSLIHVPPDRLDTVYREIRRVLTPGAPLLVLMWSSDDQHEGVLEHEWLDPPRYFSFYTDQQMDDMEFPGFTRESFTVRTDTDGMRAQVLTLRAV